MREKNKLQENAARRYSREGGLGGAEIVLNGETREKEVNFRYSGVDNAATVSSAGTG